jgi:tetratricopeptide (TPR) repeat protein
MKFLSHFLLVLLCTSSGLSQNNEWWLTDYRMGMQFLFKKNHEAAIEKFQAILDKDNKIPQAYLGLGLVYDALEPGSNKARVQFEKATKADRNFAEAYYHLGLHYLQLDKRMFEARDYLQLAVRKQPAYLAAWLKLATIHEQLWPAEVFGVYKDALENLPHNPIIHERFMEATIWFGKLDEAAGTLKELIEKYPDKGMPRYILASILFSDGKFEESIAELDSLQKYAPVFSRSRRVLLKSKNYFELNDMRLGHINYALAISAISDTSDAKAVFQDLCYIMKDDEYDLLQKTPPESLGPFYTKFWNSRDPNRATKVNERIPEHYRRLFYARKNYRRYTLSDDNQKLMENLHPFASSNVQGNKLLRATHRPKALPEQCDIDDLGLVFLRHGQPDRMVTSPSGIPDYVQAKPLDGSENETAGGGLPAPDNSPRSTSLVVPKADQGESLLNPGYLENLPLNTSWQYFATATRPEMIFHFDKHGGRTGWVMQAIPYTVAEREDLDSRYKQLGEASFEVSPRLSDIIDIVEQVSADSRESTKIAMLTETPNFKFIGKPLVFPVRFLTFKGVEKKSLVEMYYRIGGKDTELTQIDGQNVLSMQKFVGLYDDTWQEVERILQQENLAIGMNKERWSESSFADVERWSLNPGDYSFEIHMKDVTSGRLGVYRGSTKVPDYTGDSLITSDIIISGPIPTGLKSQKFNKDGITYQPHMFYGFEPGEETGLYFEIYNLAVSAEGRTNFRITCNLEPEETQGTPVISEVAGLFRSLFNDSEGKLGTSFDYGGKSADEKIYLNFRLPDNISKGQYSLILRITDIEGSAEASRTTSLLVE